MGKLITILMRSTLGLALLSLAVHCVEVEQAAEATTPLASSETTEVAHDASSNLENSEASKEVKAVVEEKKPSSGFFVREFMGELIPISSLSNLNFLEQLRDLVPPSSSNSAGSSTSDSSKVAESSGLSIPGAQSLRNNMSYLANYVVPIGSLGRMLPSDPADWIAKSSFYPKFVQFGSFIPQFFGQS